MHDLLRSYATERVNAESSNAETLSTVERLFDWYLFTADDAVKPLAAELTRLPLPERTTPETVFEGIAEARAWLLQPRGSD